MAKIGQGALKAAGRQGGKELDQVWSAFPANSSIQVVQEPGTIWNPPPQEISNQTGAGLRAREMQKEDYEPEM